MIRLILLVAIAAVAWYLYRRITLGNSSAAKSADTPPAAPGQDLVRRCNECGVHVPESAGVRYQEQFFCSPEHLNDHLRKL